jgi:hypothetical protein
MELDGIRLNLMKLDGIGWNWNIFEWKNFKCRWVEVLRANSSIYFP